MESKFESEKRKVLEWLQPRLSPETLSLVQVELLQLTASEPTRLALPRASEKPIPAGGGWRLE